MKSVTEVINELPAVPNRDDKDYCPEVPVDSAHLVGGVFHVGVAYTKKCAELDNGKPITIQQIRNFQNQNVFMGCLEGNDSFVRIGNLTLISDEKVRVGEKEVPVSIIQYIYSI